MDADVIIIGAGPGGYVAALRAAQKGLSVILIEKEKVGGVCLNKGCIPTKALLSATEIIDTYGKLNAMGMEFSKPSINLNKLKMFRDKTVSFLVDGVQFLLEKRRVKVIKGTGRIKGKSSVEVRKEDGTNEILSTANILIATGSRSKPLSVVPFKNQIVMDSDSLLSLEKIPKRLIVVGAGVIGLEIGTVYRRLGSEVIFLESLPKLTPFLDDDAARYLRKSMMKQGFIFHFGVNIKQSMVQDGILKISFEENGKENILEGESCLVAAGREPCTGGIGVEDTGIKADGKGFIIVDDNFKTNIDGIYAIGDVTGPPMLAHRASHAGIIVADFCAGEDSLQRCPIPSVVYTHPEIATCGITEDEASKMGINIKKGLFPLRANPRMVTIAEDDGVVKIISDAKNDIILGMQIVAPSASELISTGTVAISAKMKVGELVSIPFPHPSMSEGIGEALFACNGFPLHQLKI